MVDILNLIIKAPFAHNHTVSLRQCTGEQRGGYLANSVGCVLAQLANFFVHLVRCLLPFLTDRFQLGMRTQVQHTDH